MSLKLKIRFFDGEIRRTTLSSPDYAELVSKVTALLGPNYAPKQLKVTYVDEDGDEVAISSDGELKDAFGFHVDTLTISVAIKEKAATPAASNPPPVSAPAPTPVPAPTPSTSTSRSHGREPLYPEVPVFDTPYSVPPPSSSSSRDFNDGLQQFTSAFASYLQEPYEQEYQGYHQQQFPATPHHPQPPQHHQHQHHQHQHHQHPQSFLETPMGMQLLAFWAVFMSTLQQIGAEEAFQRAWFTFFYLMRSVYQFVLPKIEQWRREGFAFKKLVKLVIVGYLFMFLMLPALFFGLQQILSLIWLTCQLIWYVVLIKVALLVIRRSGRVF